MIKIFKSSLIFLLITSFLLPILSGCHGRGEKIAFEIPEDFDTTRNFEITFWAKNDTNKTQTAIYQKAISDFEALYPNIKVTIRAYTDYGKIYNDVITNIATNTTPNVCITYPDHIATYMTGENVVVPLDTLLTDKKYGLGGTEVRFDAPEKDEIIQKFLKECYVGGYCYALPFMRSTEVCYINKTYVEALGYTIPDKLTWDFIWEVSEAATAQDPQKAAELGMKRYYIVNGQEVLLPFIYKSTDNMMIQMIKQVGGEYSNNKGDILIFNDTTKNLLYTVAEHSKSGAFSTFKISGYPANFLNAGQCIFAIDSTGGATWMGSDAPLIDISEDRIVDFETVVMPIPQFDPENPQMISQGPSVCIFNKEDKQEVMASWLFVQYLLTNEVQIHYSQTEGYIPVTSKAQNDPEYLDYMSRGGEDNDLYYDVKIKASKILLENMDNTFVTPVFNGSTSLRDASGQMIEIVTKSVKRKETVDDAYIEKLYNNINSLYRLDQFSGTGVSNGKTELGQLPTTSVILLTSIAGAWVLIGGYAGVSFVNKKKRRNLEKNE